MGCAGQAQWIDYLLMACNRFTHPVISTLAHFRTKSNQIVLIEKTKLRSDPLCAIECVGFRDDKALSMSHDIFSVWLHEVSYPEFF